MKLSITDEFLWNLHAILEKGGDVASFIFSTSYQKAHMLQNRQNPFLRRYQHKKGRAQFSQLIYKLKVRGYIKIKSLEGKRAVMLTKEGLGKALRASFVMDEKQKRPDGKWIMIMFDIPLRHQKARVLLRSVLYNLGFKILQQSVWVCPYDVQEKTEKALQFYSLEKYVKIFLIEKATMS